MAQAEIKGHVRKRGSKLELVIWVDGRRVTRGTGLDVGHEAEAEALLEAVKAELRAAPAEPQAAAPDTLRAWGERWIEDRKARGKLEYVHEQSHLEHFVYPLLGTNRSGRHGRRDPRLGSGASRSKRAVASTRRSTSENHRDGPPLFKEAVRRHIIERSPCIWEDTDLPELEANARVMGCGFEGVDVQRLVYDTRIPEDRRVLYSLEFLTGMRTGEAAARTWADWEPAFLGRLAASPRRPRTTPGTAS
jgi:hypothetical protein